MSQPDTKRLDSLLRRRQELDKARWQVHGEVNEIQAKLTQARRRLKVAERDYNEASDLYFHALDEEHAKAGGI